MKEDRHDPDRNWKIIAMILSLAVLALCVAGLFEDVNVSVVFAALLMGAGMCATSGIMALAKERRVTGYLCSILSGIFLVLCLVWIARMIWWGI